MNKHIVAALLGAALAAAALALPGDLVVVSPNEVAPDEAAGLYYLGPTSGGFLYNGSEEALARVTPYRLLDREATRKEYYLVWVPGGGLGAAAFAGLGSAAVISDEEILVGLEPGADAEDLRAVDRRLELVKLETVKPLERRFDGETPPTQKDPDIEVAINSITAGEYASYIQTLQDFLTRYTPTAGYVEARDYLQVFFEGQGLKVTLFPFDYGGGTYHNVIAERAGAASPEEVVIICGHLDCTSQREYREVLAPGADDNASGVAVAMAAARAFKELEFGRTVRYCAFGGEEQGLYGSRAYALYCMESGVNLVAVLNADMVAYDEESGGRDDFSVAYRAYPWLLTYLEAVGGLYGNDLIYDHYEFTGSDHYFFWAYGYPAMAAIEGRPGVGGSTLYPYYHTIEDTLDKLHPNLAVRFARDYGATLAHLARPGYTGVEEPKVPGAAVPFSRPFAVYPNPYCYATSTGGVNFVGVNSPATVEVYDLAGRRVAREQVAVGCDECLWRPAGRNGEALAPGVYLYRVEGREQSKAGKIVIAR
ncbi:MAG: M28 family peptidase [candidate division Zixibacteria bacterium]|nr:M28 family peptidase [candidate division Zixibacteria bacterium]